MFWRKDFSLLFFFFFSHGKSKFEGFSGVLRGAFMQQPGELSVSIFCVSICVSFSDRRRVYCCFLFERRFDNIYIYIRRRLCLREYIRSTSIPS